MGKICFAPEASCARRWLLLGRTVTSSQDWKRTRRVRALATWGLGLVWLTACGGSDSSEPSGESGSATASSTAEERSSFCGMLATKSCTTEEVEECEVRLAGTNGAFVQALRTCMTAATTCALEECALEALPEVAPGYPNVPVVTQCKDKNLACATDPAWKTNQINEDCQSLVVLDAAGRARATECEAKDCDAFASCISDVSFDLDFH